jgi:hypothetical protein
VYRIPEGGLFRFVTNPSYLAELVFWAGFALFTWSLAGVFILAISMANLIPRARSRPTRGIGSAFQTTRVSRRYSSRSFGNPGGSFRGLGAIDRSKEESR